MEKDKLLKAVKGHTKEDAIGMILSNYADMANENGAMISVKQFSKIAKCIIEWIDSQKSTTNESNLPL